MGAHAARRYAETHFLSANGMEELRGLRRTLAAQLADAGFARSSAQAAEQSAEAAEGARGEDGGGGDAAATHAAANGTNIVRALVCAGLYPNLVRVRMPDTKCAISSAIGLPSDAMPEMKQVPPSAARVPPNAIERRRVPPSAAKANPPPPRF